MRIAYSFENSPWYFGYCALIKFTFSDVFPTNRPIFVKGRDEWKMKCLHLVFKNG